MNEGGAGGSGIQGKGRSSVEDGVIARAVDSLLKWLESQKVGSKGELVEDEELLYLVVALKKIPEVARTNPYKIPLPHPLHPLDGATEVCLIISDRNSGVKKEEARQKIATEKIPVKKVIPLSKLKKNYFAHEAKRKLCASYDLFLADNRILSELPRCLGKVFFSKKKHPIPVKLSGCEWKHHIQAACNSTFLYVGGGTCSVVKVAKASQSRDEIKENIKAAIEGIAGVIPKKWGNVRSIYLKTVESVSLPLYQALPDLPMKIETGNRDQGDDLKMEKEDEPATTVKIPRKRKVVDGRKKEQKKSRT